MIDPDEKKDRSGMDAATGQEEQLPEGVAVLMSAKDMKEVKDAMKVIAGLTKGFSMVFLDQEGLLKDLTDKAGREQEHQFMLAWQSSMSNLVAEYRQLVEEDRKQRQQPIEVVLCDKDRNRLDEGIGFFKKMFFYILGWMIVPTIVLCIGISMIGSASSKSNDLEDWYRQEAETAAFGHFVKKNSPVTYDVWKSGLWPKAVEKQDSIKRLHQYRKWSKKIKYSE